MSDRKRVMLLIVIMAFVSLITVIITIGILYKAAFNEEKDRLTEMAKSQARLIEEIARFDAMYSKGYPRGPKEGTLSQVLTAHKRYNELGKTEEFTIGMKEGNEIVLLLTKRQNITQSQRITFDSKLAEPMRMALSGRSGTLVGLDYRGVKVLAAHEPVAELNLGIVAKIDLAEIREPFIKAAAVSGLIGLVVICLGALFFLRVSSPLITQLITKNRELEEALSRVKLLSGLLPICASCKKIRDDKGYWNQIESYIREHSEAEFSHGICPECIKKLYPDYYEKKIQPRQ
jgi:hypothetical protein